MKDNNYTASSLYAGGWRYSDGKELMDEYDLTREETSEICNELLEMEWEERNKKLLGMESEKENNNGKR